MRYAAIDLFSSNCLKGSVFYTKKEMSTDREYGGNIFPYLMSGVGMSEMESAMIEKGETYHERSALIQSVVQPMKYFSTTAVIMCHDTSTLSASSSSDSISSINTKLKKGDIWFTIYLMLYVSYLILGSLAFRSMELETEVAFKINFRDARQHFLQKYSNVIGI